MSFVAPLMWMAAIGIALPILAHILNKNKFKETDWAAMRFLDRSVRVRSRQIKVNDILLLILRCLAILFLVLAFARPNLSSDSALASWGENRAGVVLAVDASFSMKHSVDNVTRFDKAITEVERIAETISPGAPVSVILLAEGHEVIVRNIPYEASRFAEVVSQLKATEMGLETKSIPQRLKILCSEMEAEQKEVYLITDLQSSDWKSTTPWLREAFGELSEQASVFVVPVNGDAENLSVTGLELVSGVLRKGSTTRYRATVKNNGLQPARAVRISCLVNDVTVDSKSIPMIPAGASETVSFFVPFNNSGPAKIEAKLGDDALTVDNHRRTVAMIRDNVKALVVQGTAESSGTQGRYLLDALRAQGGDVDSRSLEVNAISWTALPTRNLEALDILIMSDVPEITEQQAARLKAFVRSGKGLIWLGGDEVKTEIWNKRSGEPPLLPAVLGAVTRVRDEKGLATALDTALSDHPVCRPLRSLPEDLLGETRFNKMYELQVEPGASVVLNLAGSETPLLVEQSLGRGSVFMFSGPVHEAWNNIAITPAFPMLMQQIVTYLTGREFEKPRQVGDSLSLIFADQPDASNAIFETPSDKVIKVPVLEYRGEYAALLDQALESGFYVSRVSVQTPGMPVAVNADNGESDVRSLSAEEAEKSFEETGLVILGSEQALTGAIASARSRIDFTRFFMIAGLILLLVECLLADRLVRTRSKKAILQEAGA